MNKNVVDDYDYKDHQSDTNWQASDYILISFSSSSSVKCSNCIEDDVGMECELKSVNGPALVQGADLQVDPK